MIYVSVGHSGKYDRSRPRHCNVQSRLHKFIRVVPVLVCVCQLKFNSLMDYAKVYRQSTLFV